MDVYKKGNNSMKPVNSALTPVRAIRRKCLDCQDNRYSMVRHCETANCALYAYRMGNNPKRKGVGQPAKVFSKLAS